MKFNIHKIFALFLSGALMVGSGCSGFLDEEDPSNIEPETFFTFPEHAELAVHGIYENLRFHSGGAGIFVSNFQMLDALSGTAETETGQNSDLNNLYTFEHTGDNLLLSQWWRELYEGIGNANLAITKIPTIPNIKPELQIKWVGHAKFLRALHYFWLVQLWGDVPLMTQPVTSYLDPLVTPSRASKESVYDLIVADLKDAEAAEFPWVDASGLASRAAVKSLLAKVYLVMAGEPMNKDGYYQLAADKAKEVIDYAAANTSIDKGIGLFATLDLIRTPANENKFEHIFSIQYAAGIANAGYQDKYLPNNTNVTASGEVGTTVPKEIFLDSYEAGDKRIEEKGYYFQKYFDNGGTGSEIDFNKKYIYKHFDLPANGAPGAAGTGNSGLNYPLIRYAEVLLIYAEAQNEAGALTADAYNALAAVRTRAGLTTPDIGTFTQESFKEAVLRERWHELAFENLTWFDMIRLQLVYDAENDEFDPFVGSVIVVSGKPHTLEQKHLLLPLPAADFRNNENLRPNNPGW
ncbi:RagB/SusD family nutrient uptake outer membrane protein [Pseudochryseolinea flava]|nr:RagB/SusD family nutrient uptake outer membrane protein [Pseudochryseolinea flava]